MSQAGISGRQGEGTSADPAAARPDQPLHSQLPSSVPSATMTYYTSGCPELDGRVLGGRLSRGLGGGLVGLSAEGDVGIVLSLQVAVQHLNRNAAATARLATTLPVAHVVRLLKGVLKGPLRPTHATEDAGTDKLSSSSRAAILGRVMISRIYGHDDLQAVLDELEAGVPFQRLWSTSGRRKEEEQTGAQLDDTGDASGSAHSTPPNIVILTEMDHHFKWMRLQGHGGRPYELYGQLMRRLRALTVTRPSLDTAEALGEAKITTPNRLLVFVLNSTLTRRPEGEPGAVATADEGVGDDVGSNHKAESLQTNGQDITYRLALTALQQGRHRGRPEVFRLCCDELARAQCIEPRYKSLLDYFCSLHVCFTRLPSDLVDVWEGTEGGSTNPADSSLWVATVESDETEISQRTAGRIGVVHFTRGFIQDASPS